MNWFVRLITFGWAAGITLAPFGIYIREKYWGFTTFFKTMVNHESIHWKQQMEMIVAGSVISLITGIILLLLKIFSWWLLLLLLFPFIFFYVWYLVEWIIKGILPPIGAYKHLGYEREAYIYEGDLNYLSERKHFAWVKFMFHDNVTYLKSVFRKKNR